MASQTDPNVTSMFLVLLDIFPSLPIRWVLITIPLQFKFLLTSPISVYHDEVVDR